MATQIYDLIIIGGGQAGLAAACHAKQKNLSYIVLEGSSSIGQSWKDRYDSLVLFTPRRYSELPGLKMTGESDGYPSKDEVATYLRQYAAQFGLNIALNERVTQTIKQDGLFIVEATNMVYRSKNVIVATGPFQTPRVPSWQQALTVPHMHSADYRDPSQIVGKRVLVTGGGNSGAQIAEELAANHEVTMAITGNMRFMPVKIMGKSLFWWLDAIGLLNAPSYSIGAKILRRRGDPIIGTQLKQFIRQGKVVIRPAANDGKDNKVIFADGKTESFDTVIWCTGYTLDYSWLHIPEALDGKGQPLQEQGVTKVPGLYFLGLGWMRSRSSALLGGAGRDAAYLLDKIN